MDDHMYVKLCMMRAHHMVQQRRKTGKIVQCYLEERRQARTRRERCAKTSLTLYRALEEGLAGLAGGDPVVEAARHVTADEAQPPRHHVLLLHAILRNIIGLL